MFEQNFMKLSAAVHELPCWQRKKLNDDAENNTAVASTGSNNNNNEQMLHNWYTSKSAKLRTKTHSQAVINLRYKSWDEDELYMLRP